MATEIVGHTHCGHIVSPDDRAALEDWDALDDWAALEKWSG